MRFTVSRNTTATRVNSSGLIQSVASGVPRIDWLGQSCPGLLVEASGQNLALQSAGFEVSGTWLPTNLTVTTGSTAAFTAPDGSTDADLLTSISSSACNVYQNISFASGTYTISVFGKAGSSSILSIGNISRTTRGAWFNLAAGAVTGTVNGGTASMQDYGNGWYRCIYTSSGIVSGTFTLIVGLSDAANQTTATSGTNIYVWGAQLEAGSIATTYIPTTVAAVSRAADVISASGALVSGLIGQTEGTIYAEVDVTNRLSGTAVITLAKDSSTPNRLILYTNTNNRWRANYTDASGTIVDSSSANDAQVLGVNKLALAYGAGGDATLYCNGSLIITLSGTSTFTQELRAIFLGSINTSALFFNNRIRAAAIYTTRLSNDQLAELTRL